MSLDTAAITSDFEVLRRSRAARPNSPWRRLLSWRRIELVLRWVLGVAPVAVTVGFWEYSFFGHDHGWPGVAQRVAYLAYAACVGWSILGSPVLVSRRRRTRSLLTGVSVGLVLGTIVPAIQVAPMLAHQVIGVAVLSLSLELLNAAMLMALAVWLAGPVSVTAFGIVDTVRSVRTLRCSPLRLTEAAWILLGTFAALVPAVFSAMWPTPTRL